MTAHTTAPSKAERTTQNTTQPPPAAPYRLCTWPALFLALAAFFVCIKPAPTLLCLALALLGVLASRPHRARLAQVLRSKTAWCVLGFYAALCATHLYSSAPWELALQYVGKYARIALIPFLAAACLNHNDRLHVLFGFLAAMGLTLIMSFTQALYPGFCEAIGLAGCGPASNPTIFKMHITQGFFMTLAGALALWLAWHPQWALGGGAAKPAGTAVHPLWFGGLAIAGTAALFNVVAMLEGRTAWVLVGVLAAYTLGQLVLPRCCQGLGAVRGISRARLYLGLAGVFALVALLVFGLAVWVLPHTQTYQSFMQELHEWQTQGQSLGRSGMRLTYIAHCLHAIAAQPWFGHGIGGVKEALGLHKLQPPIFAWDNPHNQYLLFTVQAGVVGLVAYLALLWQLHRSTQQYTAMPGLGTVFLLCFAIGNLFNSFHFDMAESILFAVACALFCFPDGVEKSA